MTPRVLINDYERTPRAPLTGATPSNQKSSKLRVPRIQVRIIDKLNKLVRVVFFFEKFRLNNLHESQIYRQHQ